MHKFLTPLFLKSGHCESEETAIIYAKRQGLLPNQMLRTNCTFTRNCHGTVYETYVMDKGKQRLIFRCRQCKSKRSQRGGIAARGGGGQGTWFAGSDSLNRSNSKLGIATIILLAWTWAKDFGIRQAMETLGNSIGSCTEVFSDWWNYGRELLATEMATAAPMGGPGETVYIDETFLQGRRKYNRGRILRGNRVPPARRNYGNALVGPWCFGLAWRRPNGKVDVRIFPVARRDRRTLKAIILRVVKGGTTIISDEWRAYSNLATWRPTHLPNLPFHHLTVNHSQNFVDPITGANTQLIETLWGSLKLKVLKQMRGTSPNMLHGHLAEFWWRKLHKKTPFLDFLAVIRKYYPQ